MDNRKYCKTCSYRDYRKNCTNDHFGQGGLDNNVDVNSSLVFSYDEGGCFKVGDNFGCVHHSDYDVKERN